LYAKLRIRPGGQGKRQKLELKSKRAVLISSDTGDVATSVSATTAAPLYIFTYLFIYLYFCDCQKAKSRKAELQRLAVKNLQFSVGFTTMGNGSLAMA